MTSAVAFAKKGKEFGHSGIDGNEEADVLAKQAERLGGNVIFRVGKEPIP